MGKVWESREILTRHRQYQVTVNVRGDIDERVQEPLYGSDFAASISLKPSVSKYSGFHVSSDRSHSTLKV